MSRVRRCERRITSFMTIMMEYLVVDADYVHCTVWIPKSKGFERPQRKNGKVDLLFIKAQAECTPKLMDLMYHILSGSSSMPFQMDSSLCDVAE